MYSVGPEVLEMYFVELAILGMDLVQVIQVELVEGKLIYSCWLLCCCCCCLCVSFGQDGASCQLLIPVIWPTQKQLKECLV